MPFNLSPFNIMKGKFSPSKDVPEEVQAVDQFLAAMEPIHKVYQRQWFINLANYVGNQYLIWDGYAGRFSIPPAPSWRVRLVINKILPIIRAQVAKILEVTPEFYVAPKTTEENDFNAAKIGSKFVKSIHDSSDFNEVYDDMAHWVATCGNCYIFPVFNEDAGVELKEVMKDVNGQTLVDEEGNPLVQSFSTGELAFDLVTPFELIPDFSTPKWNEQFAVVKKKLRSVKYVKEKYGVDVNPEPQDINSDTVLRSMSQASAGGFLTNIRETVKHAVMVKDYYENPTKQFPKGRHIITAGKKLLFSGPLAAKLHGKYAIPCVPFQGIKVPNRLLAMSSIENMLPLQWKYNRGRSQIIEDINKHGRPKLFAPIDSIRKGVYTDQPGEVVEYDPSAGPAPHMGSVGPLVSQAQLDNLNRLDAELQDLGGIHDISQGKLPRRANSGIALSILEEKDGTIIAPIKKSIQSGLEKLFSFALSIAGEKYTETRTLKLLGGGVDQTQMMDFRGADLAGNDDVKVMMDAPFPTSRSAKLEFALNLKKEGVMSGQSVRRLLALDGFTNLDDILMDDESQRIAAEQQAAQLPNPQGLPQEGQGQGPSPEELEELAAQAEEQGLNQ